MYPITHMFNLSFLCIFSILPEPIQNVVYEHKINFNWIDEVMVMHTAKRGMSSMFVESVCLIKINNFVEGKTFEN